MPVVGLLFVSQDQCLHCRQLPGQAMACTHCDECRPAVQCTCLSNIALCVSEGPDNGVNDQLELVGRHGEQSVKAVISDGPQQAEELKTVLWIVLQTHTQHVC